MVDETISEKCENLYNKLNSFVESEISRDVTPQISNLNSRINALEPNLVRVKEVSGNASSVSAGGTSTKTFTVPACPSGYGWKYFSTSTGWGTVNSVSLSSTTLTVTLLNVSNTSHDISFSGALVYYPTTIKAEPHITISATNPYLLSGEVTDLVVSLVDEFGFPLVDKTVTISDGTSSYNGITNNQGIFTLPDISVSSDTTFTATYGSATDSCLVEYCLYVDYGVATEHIDHYYYNNNYGAVTVTDTGTKLQNTTGNFDLYIIPLDQTVSSSNIYKWDAPLVIEFDVVENNASIGQGQLSFTIYSNTTNQSFFDNIDSNELGHWKFVVNSNNTQVCYRDGVQQKTGTATLTNARLGFRVTNQKYLIYKNFRIREG